MLMRVEASRLGLLVGFTRFRCLLCDFSRGLSRFLSWFPRSRVIWGSNSSCGGSDDSVSDGCGASDKGGGSTGAGGGAFGKEGGGAAGAGDGISGEGEGVATGAGGDVSGEDGGAESGGGVSGKGGGGVTGAGGDVFGEGKDAAAGAGGVSCKGTGGTARAGISGEGAATGAGFGIFVEGGRDAAGAGGGISGKDGGGVGTGGGAVLTGVSTGAWTGSGGTAMSIEKFCEEVHCCGLGTLDCESIEEEKSRSFNERCEVFLMTGARTWLVLGEALGVGAGLAGGAPGLVPGVPTVVPEGAGATFFATAAGGGVFAGWRCGGGEGCCPALGSDSARWSSALKGCRQLPQRTRPWRASNCSDVSRKTVWQPGQRVSIEN